MAQVALQNVTKRFGSVVAVDEVSLSIEDKELLVLVGPSGCGKSTTLRMIAGLEEADAGTISIGERVVNRVAPKDRNIAMVFQNYALYPHMNVFNNMAFGLRMRHVPNKDIEARVQRAAAVLEIEDLLRRKPGELSGGQRQRVAVGRAIVRDPDVFLFDEPLSNLDAKLRVIMRTELVKLHRQLETTTIHVTHDQTEAMMMGHRIVVMHEGKIQQIGRPLDVYNAPANRFVAEFVGSPPMNFLHGDLRREGERTSFRKNGVTLDLPADKLPRSWSGTELTLGIRPEHIRTLPPAGRPGHWCAVPAEVLIAQPLGSETILDFVCGGQELAARIDADSALLRGSTFDAYFDVSRAHLFDTHGNRLEA